MKNSTKNHELALVMPVFNEEECLVAVAHASRDELSRVGTDFLMKLSASFKGHEMRSAWSAIAPGGEGPDARDGVEAAVAGGLDVT